MQDIPTVQNRHHLALGGILLLHFCSLSQLTPVKKHKAGHSSHDPTCPPPQGPINFFFSFSETLFVRGERKGKGVVCFRKRNQAMEQSSLGIQLSLVISPVRASLPPGSLPQACRLCSVHPPTHVLSQPLYSPLFWYME